MGQPESDLGRLLIDFGRVCVGVKQSEQDLLEVVEKLRKIVKPLSQPSSTMTIEQQTKQLRSVTNLLREYTKRTSSYCASIQAAIEGLERENK